MAKLSRFALPVVLALALTGCSGEPAPTDEAAEPPAGQPDTATTEAGPQPTLDEDSSDAAEGAATSGDQESSATRSEKTKEKSSDSQPNTLTGTVEVLTAPEVADLQGYDQTPNGEGDEHQYAILMLDSPQEVTFERSGPGLSITKDITMLRLGTKSDNHSDGGGFGLDGEHVTIEFDPDDCLFPSDTTLPLGTPSCRAYTVL